MFCPIWHIRGNRPLQKDATRHAVIFHYSMPHSDNFPKFEIFQISRPHFSKISVSKSEFLMPTYQPTTITLSISINSTLFSLSIAISGGMRVHFMKESVPSQTFQCGWTPPPTPEEFWKPARPPIHHAPGLRYIAEETPCSDTVQNRYFPTSFQVGSLF